MKLKSKVRTSTFILIGLFLILANSCKKDPVSSPSIETGSVTDVQGNLYSTVKIGDQWWMSENLVVTRYNNGDYILDGKSIPDATWDTLTKGYFCVYNNTANNAGKLYNWYAVNDVRKIAPAGWHVPSDEEWKTLEKHLGMSQSEADKVNWRGTHEGEKLKIQGTGNWHQVSDVWATNESGFSARAGGCRMFSGEWSTPTGLVFTGFWWSSSQNVDEAWYRYLDYKNANVFRFYGPKNYGFSIRCVKDA